MARPRAARLSNLIIDAAGEIRLHSRLDTIGFDAKLVQLQEPLREIIDEEPTG